MTTENRATTALSGMRVVDVTRGMAGPFAATTLADHGADVIKVEPPEGDFGRSFSGFDIWNRGKRRVALDLGTAAGRDGMLQLLVEADVLIDDADPDSATGVLLSDLADATGVVHSRISAFVDANEAPLVAGSEGAVSAAAGLFLGIDDVSGAAPGTPRDRPIFTVAPTSSFAAAHLAVQGIVAAALAERRGRTVQRIETSLLQGALATIMRRRFARIDAASERKPAPPRTKAVQRGIALTFLTVQCADGRWLQMCARQDAHFLAWLKAVGLDDALSDPRYAGGPMTIPTVEDIDEIEARIRDKMRRRDASEWLEILTAAGVGVDEFLTPGEFLAHEVTGANELVTTWDGSDQPTLAPSPLLTSTPARHPRRLASGQAHWRDGDAGPTTRTSTLPSASPSASVAPTAKDGPLSGLTIIEVAYFIAGPMATTFLAELGARVIKVEPLRGDPYRRTGVEVAHLLHGKESIALDLKDPAGIKVLLELAAQADGLLQSFRPGVAERLGFGYEQCRAINDQLVYVFSTGYGTRGSLVGKPAFHSTPNAWSGGGVLQGGVGNAPVDCSYPDTSTAIANATALLLGLNARDHIGQGQYVETCMLSAGAEVMSNWYTPDGIANFIPQDSGQHGLGAGYRLYECRDGWVFVAAPSSDAWNSFVAALSRPEWELDTSKVADQAAVRDAVQPYEAPLEKWFSARTVDEATQTLNGPGFAVVSADAETLEEYLERKELLTAASHPEYGDYWKLPAKFAIDGARPTLGDAPRCGEHTVSILSELGYRREQIAALVQQGAVAAAEPIDLPEGQPVV